MGFKVQRSGFRVIERTAEPQNISAVGGQNFEGWNRCAPSFYINRQNTLLRHSAFRIRPARNALKLVGGKFNHLIYKSMITPNQHTMHGRRVFDIFFLKTLQGWSIIFN